MRILLVEDEPRLNEFVSKGLKEQGYSVSAVTNGGEALELAATEFYDLIILDLMLPNMNGYDVLKYMKKNDNLADIPVIILSAKSSELDIVKGLDLGASDYMTKPFGILELS